MTTDSPPVIVCVDDEPGNLDLIVTVVEGQGYRALAFAGGREAAAWLDANSPDLIVSDLSMPDGSGTELLEWVRARRRFDSVPFVLVTSLTGSNRRVTSLQSGADDYINKPLVPVEIVARVESLLRMRRLAQQVERQNLELRRRNVGLEAAVQQRTAELDRLTRGLVATLEHANHLNDHDTGNHIQRVCAYSGLLANALGMDAPFCTAIERYAGLHDVGKVAIPDHILKKEGSLTRAEWEIMKTHSQKGYELLRAAGMPEMACNIARFHHEWWNGRGYPAGLAGESIPIEARIVSVADAFDALTTPRCYKAAYSLAEAEAAVRAEAGGHFDPEVVAEFFECRARVHAISRELRDPAEVLVGEPTPAEVALLVTNPDGSVDELSPEELMGGTNPGTYPPQVH